MESHLLFSLNTKAIFVEGQISYDLIRCMTDKTFCTFSKSISPKVNVIAWLDLELVNCNVTGQHITGWNDKIVVLKKKTQQLYFNTFIEKINSRYLIM